MVLDNDTLLARYAAEHYERNSISADRRVENTHVLEWLAVELGDRTLAELTPSDLMAWQGAQLKRGIAPTTVTKRQKMIRSFVGWAYSAQLMSFEQMALLKAVSGVRGGNPPMIPRPYKRSEIMLFREKLAVRYPLLPARGGGSQALRSFLRGGPPRAALKRHARRLQLEAKVALALEEGLRRIEIFNLSIADMHPENESVVVRSAKSKPGETRYREVPFTGHARQCVSEWLELRELFVPGHDQPWLTLYKDVTAPESARLHEEALLPVEGDWKWHRFRHTFATERLRAGMPLEQLQVMLGHARVEQTLGYAQIVSADVRAEAARTDAAFAESLGLTV